MDCHQNKQQGRGKNSKKVLLIGPPNIGKSALFNQLTGLDVRVANYTGTTVEFTVGMLRDSTANVTLIDAPGTYTLDATNQAEKVAVDLINDQPDGVICVLDALNLESSLYILYQVLALDLPLLVVFNRWDLAQKKGLDFDVSLIANYYDVQVLKTVATTGVGVKDLTDALLQMLLQPQKSNFQKIDSTEKRWELAETTAQRVLAGKNPQHLQKDIFVQPFPGLAIAFFVLILTLLAVVGVGMGMRRFLLLPLINWAILNPLQNIVQLILPAGVVQNILIGEYGALIKGIEWPFTLVLPYVLSFYTALSILEDTGYLPRLGVLLDGLFNKLGLNGSAIIPILLGYGCGIPAVMSTRALPSLKERIIVSVMISLSVPCISQTGAFISLLAESSLVTLFAVFMLSIIVMIITGHVMGKYLKGPTVMTIMEIPELLPPRWNLLFKRVWLRFKGFVLGGALPMMGAVALAAVLYETGIMNLIGQLLRPLVVNWLLLPEEASIPLILGVLRREMAVLPLLEMGLTSFQLFVGAVVGLFYVPCIAMIATLAREFRLKVAVFILLLTTTLAFVFGGLIAQFSRLWS